MTESTRPKIGIVVEGLTNSQQILEMVELAGEMIDYGVAPTIFYVNTGPIPPRAKVPCMSAKHSYQFDGVLCATSLSTLKVLENRPIKQNKLLMFDVEWSYRDKLAHETQRLIEMCDVRCRSKYHSDLLMKVFNKPSTHGLEPGWVAKWILNS